MDPKFLIVNTGSTSRKYGFFVGEKEVLKVLCEKDDESVKVKLTGEGVDEERELGSLEEATEWLFGELLNRGMISSMEDMAGVGVRVVAPGEYFLQHREIDDEYVEAMRRAASEAPLHLGPALGEIEKLREKSSQLRLVGVSDSAFHASLPRYVSTYGIGKNESQELGIRKFGYHGISVASVCERLSRKLEYLPDKIVVCHLGGGASATAVYEGRSVDTSMGLTPLEGLLMATRPGDIDAGAVIELGKKKHLSLEELEDYLNHKCGLLGVSGETSDMREILEKSEQGDEAARLALDVFVYRVQKYVGALAAAMNGIETLVFCASIGERAAGVRESVVGRLSYLGLEIDKSINEKCQGGVEKISPSENDKQVWVVATDELGEMARTTRQVLGI